ncbi:hypothetical protein OAO39_03370 [Pirellulaceae bacterium]|nr:hypothetical protein [Pirellulaceae bacterium]
MSAAKDSLTDPEKRSQYDAALTAGTVSGTCTENSTIPVAATSPGDDFMPPPQNN